MRSTPGVAMDPARIFYFIYFFFFLGGGQSMTVVECVCAERADYCILPCPRTIYSKPFMAVANSNAR